MAETLTFSLVPQEHDITFDALWKGIADVRKLVRAVDYAATRGKPRIWLVERLHSSAPTVEIRPADRDALVTEAIVNGVATITYRQDLAGPPPLFSEEVLEELKNMSRLFRADTGIRQIEFSANGATPQVPVRISHDIKDRVDRIVNAGYSALGSLEGELGAIKTYGRDPYFTIWESLSRQPVRCRYPVSREDEIKDLLRKRVRVIGRVNYFKNGRPRNITEFRDIVDLTPDERLPRASYGSIPDLTGGVDSVEYVNAMRG